jgi:F-type H+-transporting ATPase subunit epsilon
VTLQVALVSIERELRSGKAEMVIARTVEGEIGILTGHEPLVSLLADGVVRVEGGDGDWSAAVSGGFLSVAKDRVSVLAERAVLADDVDSAAARSAMEQARREIESASDDGQRERAMADLEYAGAQLRAVGESID